MTRNPPAPLLPPDEVKEIREGMAKGDPVAHSRAIQATEELVKALRKRRQEWTQEAKGPRSLGELNALIKEGQHFVAEGKRLWGVLKASNPQPPEVSPLPPDLVLDVDSISADVVDGTGKSWPRIEL